MISKKFLLLSVLAVSCKTSSRDDFGTQMTDVSVKVPDEFTAYESKVSFSRIDSSAKPKVVRGSDIKVKLPSGVYKIDLVLSDKAGVEIYRSCETAKSYTLVNAKEDAIIDICRSSDRVVVAKTIATSIDIIPNPGTDTPTETQPKTNPGTEGSTGTKTGTENGTGTKPGKDSGTQTDPIENETPLFFEDGTCFGLPATYEREGNEVVVRTTGTIKNLVFSLTNAPRCSVVFNIAKDIGEGFEPLVYKVQFQADEETMQQNFYINALVRDEDGLQALPCKPMLLTSSANSGAPYQCAFYDMPEARRYTILERHKEPYAKSCAAKSFQVRFDFYLNAVETGQKLKEIKLPELRVQIPLPEDCITPTN